MTTAPAGGGGGGGGDGDDNGDGDGNGNGEGSGEKAQTIGADSHQRGGAVAPNSLGMFKGHKCMSPPILRPSTSCPRIGSRIYHQGMRGGGGVPKRLSKDAGSSSGCFWVYAMV